MGRGKVNQEAGLGYSLKMCLRSMSNIGRDSAVLTVIGRPFHHLGTRLESRCEPAAWPPGAHNKGTTRRPELADWKGLAGV